MGPRGSIHETKAEADSPQRVCARGIHSASTDIGVTFAQFCGKGRVD